MPIARSRPRLGAKRYVSGIACAIALASSGLLIGLIQASPAFAHAEIDDGPEWVSKFTKYFDDLNEFNRTHPCMDYDDYEKVRDLWLPGNKQADDDMAEISDQVKQIDAKIAEIDTKIAKIEADYEASKEAAQKASTGAVPDPPNSLAQLQQARKQLEAKTYALVRKRTAIRNIQDELHKLYKEILDKPLCKDNPPKPPPPVSVRRCGTEPEVSACKPCKAEADDVNGAVEQLRRSFGTPQSCQESRDGIANLNRKLNACIRDKCAKRHAGYFRSPQLGDGEAYVSLEGGKWCTFGDGVATAMMLNPVDDDESWIDVSTAPPAGPGAPGPDTSRAPPGGDKPPPVAVASAPNDRPGKAPDKPTDKPSTDTPAQSPPTTDLTPPAPDDSPSEIPDNVELKVTEDVLEGGQTGGPIEGQTIKLMQSKKSELPLPVDPKTPAPLRTADDRGFDKPASLCVTDTKGACTIPVSADDRPYFHLPELPKFKHQNYRLEIVRPQTSGGVAEITPGKEKIDPKALQNIGNGVASSTFKIGNRRFIRFALETRYGVETSLAPKLTEAYGPAYEEDICEEKRPGGAEQVLREPDAGEPELPGTKLKLQSQRTKRGVSR
jgi:hypothetical protein